MTESNAYLAYGITVTTESLLYAVAAWPRLQGPFAFLDLVAHRKHKGTLVATNARGAPRSAVELVPIEVWNVFGISALAHTWTSLVNEVDCQLWVGFDGLRNAARQAAVVQLLSIFGLALPTPTPLWSTDILGVTWPLVSDPDSATWISLPDSSNAGASSLSVHASLGDPPDPDGQEIVDVSFAVPSNAKQRFARLVSALHLQLVEVTDGIVAHAGTRAAEKHASARYPDGRRHFRKVAFDRLKPSWKLVTMAGTRR
ncbi:hypothetical protein JCM3775_006703 [Rhodotorula graminis]